MLNNKWNYIISIHQLACEALCLCDVPNFEIWEKSMDFRGNKKVVCMLVFFIHYWYSECNFPFSARLNLNMVPAKVSTDEDELIIICIFFAQCLFTKASFRHALNSADSPEDVDVWTQTSEWEPLDYLRTSSLCIVFILSTEIQDVDSPRANGGVDDASNSYSTCIPCLVITTTYSLLC